MSKKKKPDVNKDKPDDEESEESKVYSMTGLRQAGVLKCDVCGMTFRSFEELKRHCQNTHR